MSRSILPRVLRAACTLALAGIVVGAGIVLYRAAATALGDDPAMATTFGVEIGVEVHEPSWKVLGGTPGVRAYSLSDLHGELGVTSREPRMVLAGVLLAVPALLISALLTLCLRRLLDDVIAGQPFSARSVRQLRLMGGLLILGQLATPLIHSVLGHLLMEDLAVLGATITTGWSIQVDKLVVAALPLVLAEVFQHGSTIEADQSLTV